MDILVQEVAVAAQKCVIYTQTILRKPLKISTINSLSAVLKAQFIIKVREILKAKKQLLLMVA